MQGGKPNLLRDQGNGEFSIFGNAHLGLGF